MNYFVFLQAECHESTDKYYMSLLDIILLAVALAMDCLTLSVVSGVIGFTVYSLQFTDDYTDGSEGLASKSTVNCKPSTVNSKPSTVNYFPAYEIVNDELRDYRFYASDMLHPSQQAVDYIWERLVETYFSRESKSFLEEWRPLKQALGHKPFNPNSEAYKSLMDKTMLKMQELREKYPTFAL